jgi:Flp pilus assembly secretin CpaC
VDHVVVRLSMWLRQVARAEVPGGPPDYPVLATREVRTTVTLADGQEVAIGGSTLGRSARDRTGLPYVPGIPGLDSLLSSRLSECDRTDLVLLVRPTILTPGFALPGSVPAAELERARVTVR